MKCKMFLTYLPIILLSPVVTDKALFIASRRVLSNSFMIVIILFTCYLKNEFYNFEERLSFSNLVQSHNFGFIKDLIPVL